MAPKSRFFQEVERLGALGIPDNVARFFAGAVKEGSQEPCQLVNPAAPKYSADKLAIKSLGVEHVIRLGRAYTGKPDETRANLEKGVKGAEQQLGVDIPIFAALSGKDEKAHGGQFTLVYTTTEAAKALGLSINEPEIRGGEISI